MSFVEQTVINAMDSEHILIGFVCCCKSKIHTQVFTVL